MSVKRGSLTVFVAMTMMLVAAVLFVYIEAARAIEIRRVVEWNSDSVMESMFAQYHVPLWDTYHLLGLYCKDEEGRFSTAPQEYLMTQLSQASLNPDTMTWWENACTLLRTKTQQIQCGEYLLLTDSNGAAYEEAVASYWKNGFSGIAMQKLKEQYQNMQELNQSVGDAGDKREEAKDAIANLDQNKANYSPSSNPGAKPLETKSAVEPEVTPSDNPMTQVESLEKKGILSLVLPKDTIVSGQTYQQEEQRVSVRKLETGTCPKISRGAVSDRILMNVYVSDLFGCYLKPEENGDLQYALEYVIEGETSDQENLTEVAKSLLAIREASNLLYLYTDAQKMAEAQSLATSLAGVSLNPAVIEVVKIGILASWAYAESVLDVRTLFQGKRVAITKSAGQWKSSLSNIANMAAEWEEAKDCENGLSYNEYLQCLLMLKPVQTVAYRSMDLQERGIQKIPGCESFQMDGLVVWAKADFVYQWNTIFLSLVPLKNINNQHLTYHCTKTYSYLGKSFDVSGCLFGK